MLLTCLGHAKFLIELNSGLRIVTDPFDAACGYPLTETQADAVLVSHGHHDHSAVETISGNPRIIREAGTYTLESGVTVTAIPAFHDEVQGAKRGNTLLFLLEAEGLRIAHLGDLGHLLTAEQRKTLAPEVAESLRARVIVPMHYRTKWNADWPIAPLEDFTRLYQKVPPAMPLLRVTAEDLPCQPHIAVLEAQV